MLCWLPKDIEYKIWFQKSRQRYEQTAQKKRHINASPPHYGKMFDHVYNYRNAN